MKLLNNISIIFFLVLGLIVVQVIPLELEILFGIKNLDILLLISILNIVYGIILLKIFNVKKDRKSFNISIKNIFIVVFITILMNYFVTNIVNLLKIVSVNQLYIEKMLLNSNLISGFMLICISAPFIEEIIFRKIIFQLFNNKIIGLILSSVIFALLHESKNIILLLLYFIIGLTFGGVYYKTKSIKLAMLSHFVNNFLGFLMIYIYS